ncbi:MAG: hypothetical protein ACI8PG_002054 [Planctomycetota bacterium]|jgi:hypothetical protein
MKSEECIFFSGGARGVETAFDEYAERLGIRRGKLHFRGE